METLKVMGWIFLAIAVLVGIFVAGKKGAFDKAKATNNGKTYTFSREKWMKYAPWVLGFGLVLGLAIAITGCSSGNDSPAPVANKYCPVVIEATLGASPYEDRVKALAIEAESKGIQITGDYATDVRNQGGEMTLLGYGSKLTFDADCRINLAESHGNLFGNNYPIREGGFIEPDGKFKDLYINVEGALVTISGQLVNGQLVGGEVRKSWLLHIYGVLENIVVRFL